MMGKKGLLLIAGGPDKSSGDDEEADMGDDEESGESEDTGSLDASFDEMAKALKSGDTDTARAAFKAAVMHCCKEYESE